MAPKILFFDIETAPNLATIWALWNQNIGIHNITQPGYVLCWAAKWKGSREILWDSEERTNRKHVVKSMWNLLNEADIVVHYNGRRFDVPTMNREFLLAGLKPPAPYKQIDLCDEVKNKFMFVSHKMDYIAEQLKIPKKKPTTHQLWLDCMNGVSSAWRKMVTYNKHDVAITEALYDRLRGWLETHPNMGMWAETLDHVCPNCGGKKLQARGERKTNTRVYKRFVCLNPKCGAWSRARLSDRMAVKASLVGIAAE